MLPRSSGSSCAYAASSSHARTTSDGLAARTAATDSGEQATSVYPAPMRCEGNRRKTCGAWIIGATGDQRQLAARILIRQVVRPRKQCRHLLQRILLRSLHPSSIRQALRTHMFAPSVLQPRKSEVKHGVRHREQPRKQEARRQRANRNTTPSTSATASIVRESQSPPARARPPRVQEPRAHQAPPARARPPTHARTSAAHARTPGARRDPRAHQDENRVPER